MTLYAGIDLHSNNSVVVIQDSEHKVVKRERLANRLETILAMLEGRATEGAPRWWR